MHCVPGLQKKTTAVPEQEPSGPGSKIFFECARIGRLPKLGVRMVVEEERRSGCLPLLGQ